MKKIFTLLFSVFYIFNVSAIDYITNYSIYSSEDETTEQEIIIALEEHPSPETLYSILLWERSLADETLITIGKHCPNLIEIIFCGEIISDKGVEALAKGCPKLESLSIGGSETFLTDIGLNSLASNCHNLRRIDISGNDLVTDLGIIALAENCNHLSYFNVQAHSIGQLTDATLIALAKHCPNLKGVRITEHKKITDTGTTTLAKNCPQLRYIDVDCEEGSLTNKTLLALANYCPNLRDVSVEYHSNISYAGASYLLKYCTKLDNLGIWKTSVTYDEKQKLKEHYPGVWIF